jgi:hypothetical protein
MVGWSPRRAHRPRLSPASSLDSAALPWFRADRARYLGVWPGYPTALSDLEAFGSRRLNPQHSTPWRAGPVVHIKISTNPSVGFVELWHNGANVALTGGVNTNGVSRLTWQTMLAAHADGGMGMFPNVYPSTDYTTSTGKTVVYFDRMRIGTTRAAVEQ